MSTVPEVDWRAGWWLDCAAAKYTCVSGGGHAPGARFYFEVTLTTMRSGSKNCVGVCNKTFNVHNPKGLDYSAGAYASLNGGFFISNNTSPISDGWSGMPGPDGPAFAAEAAANGKVIGIVVDTINGLLWARSSVGGANAWIGGGDPTTSTGGYLLTAAGIAAGNPLYILVENGDETGTNFPVTTLNTGASAFNMSLPATCAAWDTTGQTTLNPNDASAYVVLSNGNLTQTSIAIPGSNQPCAFVRCNLPKGRS